MAISAWTGGGNKVFSKDGKHWAMVSNCMEIAMGAPLWGELNIDNKMLSGLYSPSLVWSDDSNYLAIPRFTTETEFTKQQQIAIYSNEAKKLHILDEIYGVLELEAFADGVLTGINSPIYKTRSLKVDVFSKIK